MWYGHALSSMILEALLYFGYPTTCSKLKQTCRPEKKLNAFVAIYCIPVESYSAAGFYGRGYRGDLGTTISSVFYLSY